jgi:hypothetical protein
MLMRQYCMWATAHEGSFEAILTNIICPVHNLTAKCKECSNICSSAHRWRNGCQSIWDSHLASLPASI